MNNLLQKSSSWNFLESLLENHHLTMIDFALAERIVRDIPGTSEAAAALICHISAAIRQGHLCVRVDENEVYPDPVSCWGEPESQDQTTPLENFDKLKLLIQQGAAQLPKSVITDLSVDDSYYGIGTPLVKKGNLYYFQRYWYYEQYFRDHYRQFSEHPPKIPIEESMMINHVQNMEKSKTLLSEQAQAIINACKNSLTIICGGPGTGKTYTAGQLIRILWESLNEKQKQSYEIALAAPTGKAAANLQKSLKKACGNIPSLQNIQAKTLHNLLGVKGSTFFPIEIPSISADLIIVDECSMIDVQMMGILFASLKPGARLVLLGDNHQLPAVESGAIFADLIQMMDTTIESAVNKLHVCMRAELQGILALAAAVKEGNAEEADKLLEAEEHGVSHLKINNDIQGHICSYAFAHYPCQLQENEPLMHLMHQFNTFRILSPLRKGPLGVEEINKSVLKAMQKKAAASKTHPFVAPIILLKNEYRLDLFNGETGVLIRHSEEISQGDYALFPDRNGEELRKIPALLLPAFEYAYCLSVHKSQGSEFDHVVLLLPTGSEKFGREILYTAVTRARRKLEIYTEEDTLQETIVRQSHRLSGLN